MNLKKLYKEYEKYQQTVCRLIDKNKQQQIEIEALKYKIRQLEAENKKLCGWM